MTAPALDSLETILRLCEAAAPAPWYPSEKGDCPSSAKGQSPFSPGMARADIHAQLDRLRLGGLIRLTEWVQGRGQGYVLTVAGERVLQSPRSLARLRTGKFEVQLEEAFPKPAGRSDRDPTTFERGEAIRSALLDRTFPLVTLTLLFVNLMWFGWGFGLAVRDHVPIHKFFWSSDPEVLHATQAVSAVALLQGEWWRLLTCCFVHIGLLHLAVNMVSLYLTGPFFEQIWGRGRFLALYLIAGLGGSCAAMVFRPEGMLAGASGALWGIMGSYLIWLVLNRRFLPSEFYSLSLRRLGSVVLLNVFITYGIPGISKEAHFGGGVVGAVAAVFLNYQQFGKRWQRGLAVWGLLGLPLLCVVAVVQAMETSPQWQPFRQIKSEFHRQEERQQWSLETYPTLQRRINETLRPVQTQLEPLLKSLKDRPDSDELAQALAIFHHVRDQLQEIQAQLGDEVDNRDEAVQEAMERLRSDIEQKVNNLETLEAREVLLPYAARVEAAALKRFEQRSMQRLFQVDPRVRHAEDVRDASASLDEEVTTLNASVEVLKKAGPYDRGVIRTVMQARLQLLEAEAKLLSLAGQRLRKGISWSKEDAKEFSDQVQEVNELREKWFKPRSK